MAWFGESLSSLTGHLQNFTKEVLSEGAEETRGGAEDLKVTKEKLEELEAICTAQDLEISALKKQNAELLRRLEEAGGLEGDGFPVLPPAPTTWLSIEQRCDAGYAGGTRGGKSSSNGSKGHTRALSDATAVAAKHQERLEKELKERVQLIEHLQIQLQKVEEERHMLSLRTSELETQVKQFTKDYTFEGGVLKEQECPVSENEEKLIQENSELRTLLNDANRRTNEMEEEILSLRNQCLDHVIDSQVCTSELRLDVEQTRKRIANETGVQRAERLRAHQDMVNRMIQMGEKTRETEQNVKRLQNEDKKLNSEMVCKIQKLGDQEQQDLVHGTLKALELENQVLNMRNAQLERESLKDLGMKTDESRKNLPDGVDSRTKANEALKSEDDMDNLSFQSEPSDFTIHSRLENQVAQLQNQVEIYKRDVKHYEMVRVDSSREKSELEEQVKHLKEQLKERPKIPKTLSQTTFTQTKPLEQESSISDVSAAEKLKELEERLRKSEETVKLLHEEKQCFGQELEAMARVVQDLESKVATGDEERQGLIANMEELDQQHQAALDKLLGLRIADQEENEKLKFEVQELEISLSYKSELEESAVQTDSGVMSYTENVTQTDSIHLTDQENQTSPNNNNNNNDDGTSVDVVERKIMNNSAEDPTLKYDQELSEKIRKLINFDIPNDFSNSIPHTLYLVQEIMKFTNDCKWKKETLERKATELIRENNEYKSTITILEAECSNLKDNVERLAEQLVGVAKSGKDPLPTILENCEEMEAMEQRNAILEEEVAVLRETRVNLEEDAARIREERQELLARIRNLEAQLKNQENLETELKKIGEEVLSYKSVIEEANHGRELAEIQIQSLKQELDTCVKSYEKQLQEVKDSANFFNLEKDRLLQNSTTKDGQIEEFQRNISDLESEKNLLTVQLQHKSQSLEENVSRMSKLEEEKETLLLHVLDLKKQCHDVEEVKVKLAEMTENLERATMSKIETEQKLNFTVGSLYEAQSLIKSKEDLEAQIVKWQNTAEAEEMKVKDALLSIFNLEKENKDLREKLSCEELNHKNLNLLNEQNIKKAEELKMKFDSELAIAHSNNQLKSDSIDELNFKITELSNEKNTLEQSVESALQEGGQLRNRIKNLESELLQKEYTETNMRKQLAALIGQMDNTSELQHKYKIENTETLKKIEDENRRLLMKIRTLENNETIKMQEVEKMKSLELQLHSVLDEKERLIRENADLKTALCGNQDTSHSTNKNDLVRESCTSKINHIHKENKQSSLQESVIVNEVLSCQGDTTEICKDTSELHSSKIMEIELLNAEKLKILTSLEEKNQEIDLLNSKLEHAYVIIENHKGTINGLEEQKDKILSEKMQSQEKFEMTKETVAKLSEIIREKDQHLEAMKIQVANLSIVADRSESVNKQLIFVQESMVQAIQERDQLLQTVHVKHQESVQYHAEIQRLSALLAQELAKNQQLATEYATLVQKSNEENTHSSPKHLLEVKELQDLIKMRDEGFQLLSNRMELKDQELQTRGMELETLRHQVEFLTHTRSAQQAEFAVQKDQDLEEKLNDVMSRLQDEQRKCKHLQGEFEASQGRELALQKELERLRVHLVEIEDTYTQEALKNEEHIKELVNKLQQAEDMMKSSSTVYKSANIRANQQVETFQEQARLIAQQRDDVQTKLSASEDQVGKHSAALRNLQAVLEQFQRDREREIDAARASVYVKVEAAQRRHDELLEEISSLKSQLKEAKGGLSAASRLGEELERKAEAINRLKQEAVLLGEKLQKAEEAAKLVGQSVEGKVDKSLVKNVILGFFLAPSNSKEQVLHVVASVLDFNEDEKSRIQKKLGLFGSDGSGGWFKSLLHPGGKDHNSSQSLSEAFVRFLENESIPQPKLKMLPDAEKQASSSNSNSPRTTTPVNTQRKSPLLLADVQLPTFAQFPVGRNSSSILKDILKES